MVENPIPVDVLFDTVTSTEKVLLFRLQMFLREVQFDYRLVLPLPINSAWTFVSLMYNLLTQLIPHVCYKE
jgi:hypothetical protein